MDAIVTAGGIPKMDDALYMYTQGTSKALLDIAGKPMIQWVLDALGSSKKVNNVIIIGLGDESGLTCTKPLYFVPDQGDMISNAQAGARKALELDKDAKHVLAVSSDIPSITAEMIDWTIDACRPMEDDIYYFVVDQFTMEKRFPSSNRSFYKFKDMAVCGCDLHLGSISAIIAEDGLFTRLSSARKNAFQQARIIGLGTFVHFLLRTKTLQDFAEYVVPRLHLTGKAVVSPYAETAMDVDKPHQLEILRADLKQ